MTRSLCFWASATLSFGPEAVFCLFGHFVRFCACFGSTVLPPVDPFLFCFLPGLFDPIPGHCPRLLGPSRARSIQFLGHTGRFGA